MNQQYLSARTLNFNYLTGKQVSLSLIDNGGLKYNPLIFYIDDKTIGLSIAYHSEFESKSSASIEVVYAEHLLKFDTKIKGYDDGILYLYMPRKVEKTQQREYLRVGCNIKCSIENFTTGTIKNLSAGGAFILLDNPIDIALLDCSSFKLCFSLDNRDFRINCSAVEITRKFIRVKFSNIKDDSRELITQYCLSIDAEEFKRCYK